MSKNEADKMVDELVEGEQRGRFESSEDLVAAFAKATGLTVEKYRGMSWGDYFKVLSPTGVHILDLGTHEVPGDGWFIGETSVPSVSHFDRVAARERG